MSIRATLESIASKLDKVLHLLDLPIPDDGAMEGEAKTPEPAPVKCTVYEWEELTGIHILDYDGFRDMKRVDRITEEDFRARAHLCTVSMPHTRLNREVVANPASESKLQPLPRLPKAVVAQPTHDIMATTMLDVLEPIAPAIKLYPVFVVRFTPGAEGTLRDLMVAADTSPEAFNLALLYHNVRKADWDEIKPIPRLSSTLRGVVEL